MSLDDPRLPSDPDDDGPRMLPTVEPSSELGKSLHDAVGRLRFSAVSPEVREMAQKMLDGKAGARDLLALPEFQPALAAMQKQFRADLDAMTDEDRAAFPRPGTGAGSRG